MRFHVLTLFPQMIEQGLSESITGRALKQNIISLNTAVSYTHLTLPTNSRV